MKVCRGSSVMLGRRALESRGALMASIGWLVGRGLTADLTAHGQCLLIAVFMPPTTNTIKMIVSPALQKQVTTCVR